MPVSSTIKRAYGNLKFAINEFENLILGPKEPNKKHLFSRMDQIVKFGWSQREEILSYLSDSSGECIEISVSEPEEVDRIIGIILDNTSRLGTTALLGVEKSRWQSNDANALIVEADKAHEILFAVQQLVKSKALGIIVVSELLLKPDPNKMIWQGLSQIRSAMNGWEGSLVLINPKTPKRPFSLCEQSIICSRQIEIVAHRG